jgi:hypothetical protein
MAIKLHGVISQTIITFMLNFENDYSNFLEKSPSREAESRSTNQKNSPFCIEPEFSLPFTRALYHTQFCDTHIA